MSKDYFDELKNVLPEVEEDDNQSKAGFRMLAIGARTSNYRDTDDDDEDEDENEFDDSEDENTKSKSAEPECTDYMICIRYKKPESEKSAPETIDSLKKLVNSLDDGMIIDINEYPLCISCKCPLPKDTSGLMCDDCHRRIDKSMSAYLRDIGPFGSLRASLRGWF